MSEIQKFLFDGLPVRGCVVRLTDAWVELLRRRASVGSAQAYPEPVQCVLGEMVAAAILMQSNIKFNGVLILQIMGDGPVKLAVAEVQPDFSFRATASVVAPVAPGASLQQLVNLNHQGRCAITLDPKDKFPGQKPYQGVVPLTGMQQQRLECLSAVLEHYMFQSEQLETTLVLAADHQVASGLLIQRLPLEGVNNLAGTALSQAGTEGDAANEDYQRIALLASSLKREELLSLDVQTILRRLFWQEPLLVFEPLQGERAPRFSCTCSRDRVGRMILGLGAQEAQGIVAERGDIEVGCEFCGIQYRFDAVDVTQLFALDGSAPPASSVVQ